MNEQLIKILNNAQLQSLWTEYKFKTWLHFSPFCNNRKITSNANERMEKHADNIQLMGI